MLLKKDILQDGHPTLRKRAIDVKLPLSKSNFKLLHSMMEYIENSQDDEMVEKYSLRPSVGLAAPQIDYSMKMFAMKTMDEKFETLHKYAVVNPKIISYSVTKTYLPGGEGCLSVDEDITGIVIRSKKIRARVNLVNLETNEVEEKVIKLTGYPAIVFQHEYDHLLGVMFTDKIEKTIPDCNPIEFKEPEIAEEQNLSTQ
ncbi:MAG: peptide deformylase [Candidatus Izimaplasma sp.]|nr:peptide deformylase [Candidatus Izimaplasma bacterium]